MTQQIMWTVTVVGDSSAIALYADHINRSKAIAELIDCDYNSMLDWYYTDEGCKVSELYVGREAYYAGAARADLTTNDMRHGFDLAHDAESMTWNFDDNHEDSYRNQPGFAESGRYF